MINVFAYTDETGNTGLNLFDENQPYFWTGTLLTNIEIDEDQNFNFSLRQILQELAVNELHAAELGYGRLELVSNKIYKLITDYDMKFHFARVEKRHVASLKIFDYVYDGYNNPAASKVHYTVRPLRLPLAYEFVQRVRPDHQVNFWEAYKTRNITKILEVLRKIRIEIINKTKDRRISELLIDGLNWAMHNPDKVFPVKRSLLDSPNLIALGLLINNLNQRYDSTPFQVKKFIHDEQNQFAKDIRFLFSCFKSTTYDTSMFSTMFDFKEVDTILAEDVIIESSSKLGSLQIVDVALWMMRRRFEKGDAIDAKSSPDLAALKNCIITRSTINEFTSKQLMEDVIKTNHMTYKMPFSKQQHQKAKQMLETIEMDRKFYMKRITE